MWRRTIWRGTVFCLLAVAAGSLRAELPPWTDVFRDEPDTSLARRLAAGGAAAIPHDTNREQTIQVLRSQRAVVFRPAPSDSLQAEPAAAGTLLAAWTLQTQGREHAGYRQLEHREDVWYESTFWQGSETWLRVGRDWHHPGEHAPSIRRFSVPRDGRIRIGGRVYKAHCQGDGVGLTILHNARQIWRQELAGGDGQGVEPILELDVRRGDAVRFVVDKLGSIACDTTHWDPIVSYPDGSAFQASRAFDARRQGAENWWYEVPETGATTGLPRLLWFDANWLLRTAPLPDYPSPAPNAPAASPAATLTLDDQSMQPVVVLTDEQDQSGIVLAIESGGAWQLEVKRSADGEVAFRVIGLGPGRSDSPPVSPAVTLGAYQGTAAAGLQRVSQWLAGDAGVPLSELQRRFHVGVPELEYWFMIQQDWQRQDGTEAGSSEAFTTAFAKQLEQTRRLLAHLQAAHGPEFLASSTDQLEELAADGGSDVAGRYLQLRLLKRRIALANPLMDFGRLLFCKRVPTSYSHLVMQHYGWRARPGGGLFILEAPGRSLHARDLLQGRLEGGSVLEPRLSYDAQRIVFSYVACPDGALTHEAVSNDQSPTRQFYHLWEVSADGTGLRQLTSAPYDDLMPCYLPGGGIAFVSTRRKGYARCFGAQFSTRWDVYTLHRMDADGSNIRLLSYHDTNEWYPAVSNTGHLLYARWDYIDRDAVTHQNLWGSRPDGTNPLAVWGNATPNPHCTFQAQPIPGSRKILFTASAHHSITAGSIALLDPAVAVDGPAALERITPEIPFPESESRDIREYYAAPWPLSEDFYLVAYSPHPLVWEPGANRKDALGLYLLDRFGNRELIYRDATIGSTCPCPLRPRREPPVVGSAIQDGEPQGTLVIADVNQGLGPVSPGQITALRIVQIFPKTTPVANQPPIGLAGEENGRAVLGSVPVEPDGSAHFTVPAGKPLLFQALDRNGFAWQTMRSITYVQPGEHVSCVGCHEHARTAPVRSDRPLLALRRPPSAIEPGLWGGRPFSYVEVVQPVLDQHCVRCHGGEKTEGDVILTGEPAGAFNRSYLALMTPEHLVPRFAARNQVQVTAPGGQVGALGSRLMRLLIEGHEGVQLSQPEMQRLALWIDLNAIFYGTNQPGEQAAMLRGECVGMPGLQ